MKQNFINKTPFYLSLAIFIIWQGWFNWLSIIVGSILPLPNPATFNFFVYATTLGLILLTIIFFKKKIKGFKITYKEYIFIFVCYWVIKFLDFIPDYIIDYFELAPGVESIPQNQIIINEMLDQNPYIMNVITWFLGPITEEFIYRYGMHRFLFKYFKFWPAAIIISMFFGFSHILLAISAGRYFEMWYLISYAGASLTFSFIYYYGKRITLPIYLHILVNMF